MLSSISQLENPIDENIVTAIFYSISDLGDYIIEIRHHHTSKFIKDNDKPIQFGNMQAAKKAAIACGAVQGFTALSKTYQEVEASSSALNSTLATKDNSYNDDRYDYISIELT